ncbi:MAG TPA: Yip1 family protein [Candidatus Acidoferrales bacterium]|jgi:hypothetical protein
MSSTSAASPDAAPEVGALGRIAGVFFSPEQTFDSIVRRPSWVLPVILLCLVSCGVTASFGSRVGWRTFMQKQLESNSRVQQLPPDKQEQVIDQQTKLAPAIGYIFGTVGTFIFVLIAAGVLFGVFNYFTGTKLSFGATVGIVAHSWLPYVIAGLLGILVIFLKDPSTADLRNLIASNPGAFLSEDSPKWLVSLLTSLDIFTFWVLVLQGIGFHAANPKKLTISKAFFTVLAVFIIFTLVKVGIAAAFS